MGFNSGFKGLTNSVGVLADFLPNRRLNLVKPSLAIGTTLFLTVDIGNCIESANVVKAKGFKSKPADTAFLGDFTGLLLWDCQ